MANNLPEKIMVVDNDEGVLNAVARALEAYKIQVITAKDWQSALYQFNHHRLDLCLVSLELDELAGGALIQKWRKHEVVSKRDTAFILSSAKQRKSADESLLKELGDLILISKPISTPALLGAMATALGLAKERQKINELTETVIQPLLNQKRFDKALVIAKEKLEPIGDRGLFLSAKLHGSAEKNDEALQKLKVLLERDPHNMSYHNEAARIYLLQGDYVAAKKAYEIADQVAPFNLDRLNEMAELYLQMKMPEKSIEKMKEIIKLTPEDQELKYGMYERIYNAGYVSQAQDFCSETSTPKELVRHFNNRGVMFAKTEDYKNAIEEYAKAIRFIPGSKELYRVLYNMAISHINLKSSPDLQRAHELLLDSLKLEPKFDKAREKLLITSKHINKKTAPSTP